MLAAKTAWRSRRRHADHVADDRERHRRGDLGDEVALALLGDRVDHLGGAVPHLVEQLGERLRGEAVVDEAAQLLVARVVHVDDRADEVGDLLGDVADVGAAAPEQNSSGCRLAYMHVVVPGERPVARALAASPGRTRARGRTRSVLVAQRLEPGLAVGVGCGPELGVAQLRLRRRSTCAVLLGGGGPRR